MTSRIDEIRASLELRSTDELVSILRNRDTEEWRPEVFGVVASILSARGVSTTDVMALGPEGAAVVESQAIVTVGSFFDPVHAHAGRLALEAAGLQAWVTDEILGGMGVGSRLQVRIEDQPAALEILGASSPSADCLPADLAEPPCPRCGSRRVRSVVEHVSEPPEAHWRNSRIVSRWVYDCEACGNRWPDEGE